MKTHKAGVEYDDEAYETVVVEFNSGNYPVLGDNERRIAELKRLAECPGACFALREISGANVRFTVFLEKSNAQ